MTPTKIGNMPFPVYRPNSRYFVKVDDLRCFGLAVKYRIISEIGAYTLPDRMDKFIPLSALLKFLSSFNLANGYFVLSGYEQSELPEDAPLAACVAQGRGETKARILDGFLDLARADGFLSEIQAVTGDQDLDRTLALVRVLCPEVSVTRREPSRWDKVPFEENPSAFYDWRGWE